MVSDAVTVQAMVVPTFCGGAGDALIDRIWTVAEAGTDNAVSNPIRQKELVLEIFMEVYTSNKGRHCP